MLQQITDDLIQEGPDSKRTLSLWFDHPPPKARRSGGQGFRLVLLLLAGSVPSLHAMAEVPTRLKTCPDKPNCVSSQAAGGEHAIEPLHFTGDAEAAWQRLLVVVAARPGTVLVQDAGGYMRAETTSRVFRFVDDVEFMMDPAAGVIHVRSASRSGYFDFGVNRRRVESIRERFERADARGGKTPGVTPR